MVTQRHANTDLHDDINLTLRVRIVIWNTFNYIKKKNLHIAPNLKYYLYGVSACNRLYGW